MPLLNKTIPARLDYYKETYENLEKLPAAQQTEFNNFTASLINDLEIELIVEGIL